MNIRDVLGSGQIYMPPEEGPEGASNVQQQPAVEMQVFDTIEPPPVQVPTTGLPATPTGPSESIIPNDSSWNNIVQQNERSCGTTSLTMILNYYGISGTPQQLDDAIRRWDWTGAVPNDLLDYARSQGLEAQGYNNSTIDQLKGFIDKGYPVQVLCDPNDTNELSSQHYIDVVGYGTDANGQEYIKYHDPQDGKEKTMPMSDFQRKWGDLWGGFNNYMNVYAPAGSNLPPGRDDGIEATNALADGGLNITNGTDRVIHPDSAGGFVHGLMEVGGGLVQGIGGGIGYYGFQIPGDWINSKVEGIPVLENIVQPLGDLWNTCGDILGHACDSVGESIDDFGNAIECLGNGDFSGAGQAALDGLQDLGTGVADVVTDVVSGVGDAIGDLFSGW